MQDHIIYTALCYVEMLGLQFTWEYTIQGVLRSNVCLTLTLNEQMFGHWEKFDRQFYLPYLPHSSKAPEQSSTNRCEVGYIRCGFPFRSTFFGFRIFMRIVGWNKAHFCVFKLFINFDRSVNPEVWSRSLQNTCIFIGSVTSVPTTKLNLGMNLISF